MGRIKGKQFGGIGDLKKKTDFYIAHSAHEFLLSGKPSSYLLGGFSVPLEAHFLKKKSAIVYLFVYFLRFAEKMHEIKKCVKV